MKTICFSYPGYLEAPRGRYLSLDEVPGSAWGATLVVGSYLDPIRVFREVQKLDARFSSTIPGSEEGVLVAGFLNSRLGLPGLSLEAAIASTYRFNQRTLLERHCPHRNPRWFCLDRLPREIPNYLTGAVVKAPASVYGFGTIPLNNPDSSDLEILRRSALTAGQGAYREIAILKKMCDSSLFSIVEEKLPLPQWEISGVIGYEGQVRHLFRPLAHVWNAQGDRILEYQRADKGDCTALVQEVASALGLRGCPVNMELRGEKVIECHARLPEDIGTQHTRLMSPDEPPAQTVFRILSREARSLDGQG